MMPSNPFEFDDLTIFNRIMIKFADKHESLYRIKEVWAERLVILQDGVSSPDTLYKSHFVEYDFDIFVLDKEKNPEYFL